ncbi:Cancer-related nucleoside-triphosphatase [Stylophora pistillata]|uniref:Cancer-related nucleoside-triphosphatase n=2 Tax=Stylophora pistillata TaxID=50429 RepID=A0A2B4SDI6_STYPI|nr:Cancer-related nucleoside-triphosphatase [Stylophora pistillata]
MCRKVYEALRGKGIQAQGFYTEEVRNSHTRSRVGFDVVTLNGQRGPLARTKGEVQSARERASPSVGNYSVDVKSFEELALSTIMINTENSTKVTPNRKIMFIVDEIGKMELFSDCFVRAVRELFSSPQATILATVPVTKQRPIPFVDELKNRRDVTLIEVTKGTRDELVSDVVRLLEDSLVIT